MGSWMGGVQSIEYKVQSLQPSLKLRLIKEYKVVLGFELEMKIHQHSTILVDCP
jgi:hypothetical protein